MMELLGQVAFHFQSMRPLFPTYLHLLMSAIFPIYTAAHASLSRPTSAAPRKQKKPATDDEDEDEEEDDDESPQIESLTPSDAILFPLLAGATLASLYFILKWLQDPAWLNWILGIYFSQIGLFFAMKFLKDVFSVVRSLVFPKSYSGGGLLWEVDSRGLCFKTESGKSTESPFPGWLRWLPLPSFLSRRIWTARSVLYTKARLKFHIHKLVTAKSPVDILDVASLVLSCAIVYYHTFVSKPWFLTNFLGFSFCYGSLQYMTPTTAWTGTLVLCALFFYDIYFVFFTPMMVTVATKLDVPIKLLFPRPDGCVFPTGAPEDSPLMQEYLDCLAKKRTMAMLGLGDIVVPGMMLAFALRFDLYLHYLRQRKQEQPLSKDSNTASPAKPVYRSATGSWGERFWTSSKLRSTDMKAKQFPKPYLHATILGYLVGMIVTVVVMQVAQHAQPALLYLVPGVLLSLWGTALLRGDLRTLWRYSELPEDEDDKKTNQKEEKEKEAREIEPAGDGSDKIMSNGSAKTNGTDLVPAQAQQTENELDQGKDKPNSKGDRKAGRRLVSFSITVPNLSSVDEKTVPVPTKSSDNVEAAMEKHLERGDDGEPPEKRVRRA